VSIFVDIGLLKSIVYEANLPARDALNLADYDMRTPLHLAACEGSPPTFKSGHTH